MRKIRRDKTTNLQNKKRIMFFMASFFAVTLLLIVRLGYIQLIKGNEYRKEAYEQWSKDVVINAKRGTIYDVKGKKLAVSVNASTVVCFPDDVKKGSSDREIIKTDDDSSESFISKFFSSISNKINGSTNEELLQESLKDLKSLDEIAGILANILEMEKEEVHNKITSKSKYVILKKYITNEQAEKIKEAEIGGISIIDDNKRVYPYGNFASYILGFTDADQKGLYGVEATFDKYLSGIPGRLVVNTDAKGRELPFGFNEYYKPQDGYGIVLTIDETLQHFAEKAVQECLENTKAKRVNFVAMDPKTGDILAMTSKHDYDPNNPREPLDEETKKAWEKLSPEELQKQWYDLWRNPIVNDIYEPGSTFKPLVIAMALQENKTQFNRTYYCDGFVKGVPGTTMKCWRYYNPHGNQTLAQILQNSCNDAMADIGLDIGAETFYKYLRALGFGEISGIALNGEAKGIVNHYKYMTDANIVRQSIGQTVAVTPLQIVSAISCLANDGMLMEPRIVKQLIDTEGNIIKNFDTVKRRTVFSEEVADAVMDMMETVVSEGGAKKAAVPGYSVGGKTGTAQKVIDGVYPEGIFISSFVGVAPTYDPKVVCLMTVDEPVGTYYASLIAAPIVGDFIEETMKYMEIEPKYTEKELGTIKDKSIEVPNFVGMTLQEASHEIEKKGLIHNVTMDVDGSVTVKDQFPKPGTMVSKKSIITLILD